MLVWIFQSGEPIHSDDKNKRPMRAINLSNALIANGHHVVLWTSSFYHQERKHRTKKIKDIRFSKNLLIKLIPSCGYSKNIGIKRLIDHAQLSLNLFWELRKNNTKLPNISFIGYPPIETAFVLIFWMKIHKIFTFLDVKDQWPDLFLEAFQRNLRPIAKFLLSPYFVLGKFSLKNASAITSTSKAYVNWALSFANRNKNKFDSVLPLVSEQSNISKENIEESKIWWSSKKVDISKKNKFCFVGNINYSYNFSLLRDVAVDFEKRNIDCQFVICGKGDQFNEVEKLFEGLKNTIFPGWISYSQIKTLMNSCVASIAPYKNISNFNTNLTNKFIDSFSSGLPVITGLTGEIKKELEDNGVCLFCEPNFQSWKNSLEKILFDKGLQLEMSKNCNLLYEKKFTYKVVYDNFVKKLEQAARY